MATLDLILLGGLLMLTLRKSVDWGGGWTWPVPDMSQGGRLTPAVISQEYKEPGHAGVDIMYRGGAVGRPPSWFAPLGTPILAARDGVVWSVTRSARGIGVVIDHGAPWATYYQHLDAVVDGLAKGVRVVAGGQIGTMGADPTDPQGLRHLHFETWYKGAGKQAVNPGSAMATWRRVDWTA